MNVDDAVTIANEMDKDIGTKKRISDMTDNELKEFLSVYTISYNTLDDSKKKTMLTILKKHKMIFDSAGETNIPYGYIIYNVWAKEIDAGIKEYYGDDFEYLFGITRELPTQNVFHEAPSDMGNYNCYAFAIDWTICQINPGFSANITLDYENETALSLATYAKMDLQSSYKNMSCVKITTTCPTDSIFLSGKNAICVRKGFDGDETYGYHFMKLQSAGWLSKPGITTILLFTDTVNGLISTSIPWYSEYTYYENGPWYTDDMIYSGPIYYLIYQHDHSYQWVYTGNNYHAGHYHYYQKRKICLDCGTIDETIYEKVPCSGPPCPNVIGKHLDSIL